MIAAAAVATPSVQLGAILPAVLLTTGALVLLIVGSFESKSARVTSGVIGLLSFAGAGLATWHLWNDGNGTAFSGQLATDRYAALVQAIVCASGVASILLGWGTRRLGDRIAEYYSLLCFAGAGMCVLAAANGFVSLFVALELFSISLYVLCALDVHNGASLESGLKYLITGSVGSAALLFGSGLAYISTGSLRFDEIGKALDNGGEHTGILLLGIAMVVAGLAFKASAAPFHMWTPDVYEGAPTAVMAFMATATKTIALATLLRLMTTAFAPSSDVWEGAVAAVAIASMLIGNIAALRQSNVKRMLAYSSVGQAGYLLIAVVVHTPLATRALLYYLAVYAAMNLGALAVVSVREREVGGPVSIGDLRGLGRDHPAARGRPRALAALARELPAHRRLPGQALPVRLRHRRRQELPRRDRRDRDDDLARLLPALPARDLRTAGLGGPAARSCRGRASRPPRCSSRPPSCSGSASPRSRWSTWRARPPPRSSPAADAPS